MPTLSFGSGHKAGEKLKVVMVGTGSRGIHSWGIDLVGPYADHVEMVGLCDINHKRVEVAKEMIGIEAKTYHSDNFDLMIREQKPDIVIVTTTDCYHVDYIVRALAQTSGNRTQAASLLEISLRSLMYKIKEYDIE